MIWKDEKADWRAGALSGAWAPAKAGAVGDVVLVVVDCMLILL